CLGRYDPDAVATAIAPSIERIDHRPLGLASARGAEAFLHWLRSADWVAEDIILSIDDVLDLCPDAILVRRTDRGVDRSTGGPFEYHHLQCAVFGADGLVTRSEWFAPHREDEALARFDALVRESELTNEAMDAGGRSAATPFSARGSLPATVSQSSTLHRDRFTGPPAQRRVRSNAATEHATRIDAAIAARDSDAIAT